MAATIDPTTLASPPDAIRIGILERNRSVLQRVARVMRAASNLDGVVADGDPNVLRSQLSTHARVLACDAEDAGMMLGWIATSYPHARLAVWGHDPRDVLRLAERDDKLVSLLGWPRFQSTPRTWEIALATRMLLASDSDPTSLADLFVGAPVVAEFRPATPSDRDKLLRGISQFVERAGAPDRVSSRIADVGHELVMNATFDAPVNVSGEVRYASDRRAEVVLELDEVPLVQVSTDGILVALQVRDPFGRLSRDHVLASIMRGAAGAEAVASEVIDVSNGGAGLGLWRVYSQSAVTIVDIVPGHSTTVTAVFDMDVGPRDARNLPPSLHLFDRGRMG
jgi:hypothetical protein